MEAITCFSASNPYPSHMYNIWSHLEPFGIAGEVVAYRRSEKVYSQGDVATEIFYIYEGTVKLSVVNELGKMAVVAMLGPGDLFGEAGLAGQGIRTATATAVVPSTLLIIEKQEMVRMLHDERTFSDRFMAYMIARNIRIEQDLIDQLLNSSEKRLARTLLLLSKGDELDQAQRKFPSVSQETLAEMIGTTRGRVNYFMKKFRELGFISYNQGSLHINAALLSVVLPKLSPTLAPRRERP
jgi:CRP/FNR family cyclic AMP-dependent transcriptional regulator